jgi:transcription elongation factor GreA
MLGGDKVKFGAFVELEDIDNGTVVTYRLVGPAESDLAQGKISITSPVARAIVGKEVGDEVQVQTPGGVRNYEVSDVRWD